MTPEKTRSTTSALWAALPAGSVLAVDPVGLSPFGPAKWALVPTVVLAGLASSVAGRRLRLRLGRAPAIAWLAFLGITVVAALVGLDGLYAWTGTPERRFGVLTWVLCAAAFAGGHVLDGSGRRRVAWSCVGAAGLAGSWAVAEAAGWRPLDLVGAGARPVGPLGSSAFLGAALAWSTPIALAMASVERRRVPRAVAVVATAAGAAGLVTSGARASWLAAVATLLVVAGLRRRAVFAVVAAALVGAAAVAALAGAGTGPGDRLADAFRQRDGGVHGRIDEWRVALGVIGHHPVLGVGPEGYRIDFGAHVDDAYEQAHGRDPLPDRAHSSVLDVAATTGLVGLAAYLGLLAVVGRCLVRAVRTDDALLVGAAAGVIAYHVQALFLFPLAPLEPAVWLVTGVVVARTARADEWALRRGGRAVAAVAAVGVLAVGVAGALDVVADRRALRVLDAGAAATTGEALGAARLRPDELRYRLVAARAFEARGGVPGLERALVELGHAARLSRRDPVVASERARLLLDRARETDAPEHIEAARLALERLARRDPRNAEVLLRLGLVRALDGDDAGAERAWLRAEHLAPRSTAATTNLAVAYAGAGRRTDAEAAARRVLAREPGNQRALQVIEALDGT